MPEEAIDERLAEGVRLARGGLLDKAIQQLDLAAASTDPPIAAEALRHLSDVHRSRCDWAAALECAERSGRVAESAALPEMVADALNAEASVHISTGDFGAARKLLRRMIDVSSDQRVHGIAVQNLGMMAAEEGRLEEARRHFQAALRAFHKAGYDRGSAVALLNWGRILLLQGEPDVAEEICLTAERLARGLEDLELVALACLNLAESYLGQGRPGEAERPASEATGYFAGVGNDWRRVECLRLFGDIHEAAGDRSSAERCYGRGLELAGELGAQVEVDRLRERLERLSSKPGSGDGECTGAAYDVQ